MSCADAAAAGHLPQDRLHRLHLLELPTFLRWTLQAVLPLLAAGTRDKIALSSIDDADLPTTIAFLSKRWGRAGRGAGRARCAGGLGPGPGLEGSDPPSGW